MARILGMDITRRDILPVFEEYCTKDIDDVKIGVLTHLADFFQVRRVCVRENLVSHRNFNSDDNVVLTRLPYGGTFACENPLPSVNDK